MTNINEVLTENKKPFEIVQELEKYEIKKSSLSLAARNKVINKEGKMPQFSPKFLREISKK